MANYSIQKTTKAKSDIKLTAAQLSKLKSQLPDKSSPEAPEMVHHPRHYNSNPSGVECIDVIEHMSLNVGNAVKYLWRVGLKHDSIEDLEKARFYVEREISRIQKFG